MSSFLRSNAFNIVAATLLTLAVWTLAAERTSVNETISGRVQLVVPDTANAYLASGTTRDAIELRVNGSRGAVDRARRALAGGITIEAGQGGWSTDPGDATIDLARALAAASEPMRDLAILWAEPATLKVTLGTLTTVKALVASPLKPEDVEGEQTITPTEVSVRLPAEALAEWPEPRRVNAQLDVATFSADQPRALTATLRAPTELARWTEHVRIDPVDTTVRAQLRRDLRTVVLPRVPLRINASPRAFNEFLVRIDGATMLEQVEVSGSRAAIASLESWTGTPYAQVDLADRALSAGEFMLPISNWNLPTGVEPTRVGERPAASVVVRIVLEPVPVPVTP